MRATGIIAEYNPFHNGHAHQAVQARSLAGTDAVIAVMSGHITQRGEIAIYDKWSRARAAVQSGVDLVLELPVAFSARSAQYFAAGGVRLLQRLGIVSHLSFGAEDDDLLTLAKAADGLETSSVTEKLKMNLKSGKTYAAAVTDALAENGHTTKNFLIAPNNILGVEYLRALKKFAPGIKPLPILRVGSNYHCTEITGKYSSATAIRHSFLKEKNLTSEIRSTFPDNSLPLIELLFATGRAPADPSCLDLIILYTIRHINDASLRDLPEISEGLENRLRKAANAAGSVKELLALLKSKRYPFARLQRILAHLLLGTDRHQLAGFDEAGPLYARVLAMNSTGRAALRAMSVCSSVPVITKTTAFLNAKTFHSGTLTPLQSMLALDITATDLFSLCLPSPDEKNGGNDFCRSAVYIPNP